MRQTTKQFTLLVLDKPAVALKAAKERNMMPCGFVDLTPSEDRPETLLLVRTDIYALTAWHDEPTTKLIWSIQGDALAEVP